MIDELFTSQFRSLSIEFKTFEDLVEETVDLEMVEKGEFMVNASFDEVLQELKSKITHVNKTIEQHEDDTRALLGNPASLKLESDKTHGHFFKLTKKGSRMYRNKRN
jgi:DNA mismatch repair protein MSH2